MTCQAAQPAVNLRMNSSALGQSPETYWKVEFQFAPTRALAPPRLARVDKLDERPASSNAAQDKSSSGKNALQLHSKLQLLKLTCFQ